jgi:hypothetical protein
MTKEKKGTRQKAVSRPEAKQLVSLMEVQEKLGMFKPEHPAETASGHHFLKVKPLGYV